MRSFSRGADLQSRQVQSPSDAEASLMNPAPRFTFKHCKEKSHQHRKQRWKPCGRSENRIWSRRDRQLQGWNTIGKLLLLQQPPTPQLLNGRGCKGETLLGKTQMFSLKPTRRLVSPIGGAVQLFLQLLPEEQLNTIKLQIETKSRQVQLTADFLA